MFYVCVLKSLKDSKFYVGYTANLRSRIAAHENGTVLSTRTGLPIDIVYYEASRIESDALRRGKYLKSIYGKRYIRNRIRDDLLEK